MKQAIHTKQAPAAIGTYSQAIRVGSTVYLSGQIPLDPVTQEMIKDNSIAEVKQVFENLKAVAIAAGGSLDQVVRVGIYLTDFAYFPAVNEVMAEYFQQPYPARTTIGVAALPKGAGVEVDAMLVI